MDQRMIAKIQRFDYESDLSCWLDVISQPYSMVILPFPPIQLDNFPVILSKECAVNSGELLLGCLFRNSLAHVIDYSHITDKYLTVCRCKTVEERCPIEYH